MIDAAPMHYRMMFQVCGLVLWCSKVASLVMVQLGACCVWCLLRMTSQLHIPDCHRTGVEHTRSLL